MGRNIDTKGIGFCQHGILIRGFSPDVLMIHHINFVSEQCYGRLNRYINIIETDVIIIDLITYYVYNFSSDRKKILNWEL